MTITRLGLLGVASIPIFVSDEEPSGKIRVYRRSSANLNDDSSVGSRSVRPRLRMNQILRQGANESVESGIRRLNKTVEDLWNKYSSLERVVEAHTSSINAITAAIKSGSELVSLPASDSPYTVTEDDELLFCDTTLGDFTVNLPTLSEGKELRIFNVGSVGNDVILIGDIFAETSEVIHDDEVLEINYSSTYGWR
jgi:hypothetical protein